MVPTVPHVLAMTWHDGLFAHWPVDPDRLRPHIPAPLDLDTFEGAAWLGVLPFVNAHARPRGLPRALGRTVPELNVRTYVRHRGDPGAYFFDLVVPDRHIAALAELGTGLPYRGADLSVAGDEVVDFRCGTSGPDERGGRFAATYRPTGAVFRAIPGSLDHWLAERRRLFVPRGGRVWCGAVRHGPWPLQPAEAAIAENTLFAALGLPLPEGDPRLHYAATLPMTATPVLPASWFGSPGRPSTPHRSLPRPGKQ